MQQEAESFAFVPLLNGAEKPEFVRLREELYEKSWSKIHGRIEVCIPGPKYFTDLKAYIGLPRKLCEIPILQH